MCDDLKAVGDNVVIACFGDRVQSIDLRTGELLWEYSISEKRTCPPVVSEQSIWLLSVEGELEEIDLESGRCRARFQSDRMCGGQAMEYDPVTKRLFVSAEAGLLCLSQRTESLYFSDKVSE